MRVKRSLPMRLQGNLEAMGGDVVGFVEEENEGDGAVMGGCLNRKMEKKIQSV